MRLIVHLLAAAFIWTAQPAIAQTGQTSKAFWKNVQTLCNATAAKPSGALGQRISQAAIDEFTRFGGHRIDSNGQLFHFGPTEAEHGKESSGKPPKAGDLGWWRVIKYWRSLYGKDFADKLEARGYRDASAIADDSQATELLRTDAKRLLQAAEAETDPEIREVLREAALRVVIIDTPWSAAFISYVIRQAGVAENAFKYSNAHRTYIYDAFAVDAAEAAHENSNGVYRACPLGTTKPRIGDLLCQQREPSLVDASDADVRERIHGELSGSTDTRTVRRTHCEVVAYIDPAARKMYTIGGNVNQSITARKLNLRQRDLKFSARQKSHCGGSGHWTLPQPSAAEPRPKSGECSLNDRNWFVLLQLR